MLTSRSLIRVSPVAVFGYNFQPSLRTFADAGSASSWGWAVSALIDTPKIPDAPFTVRSFTRRFALLRRVLTSLSLSQQFVDAEDVARAHYGAVTAPAAAGKRYLLAGERFSYQEVARLAAKVVPESASRFASVEGAPFPDSFWIDGSAAERDFGFKCKFSFIHFLRS